MIGTALSFLALILYYIGILKTPRKEKENGFELLIVATVLMISLGGLAALVFTLVRIPVTLLSMSCFLLVMDAILWGRCIQKKEFSKCVWPRQDFICLLVLFAVVLFVAIKTFGIKLNLNYTGVDPVRYLTMALDLLERKTVKGEFLTDLVNGMFIAFLRPFLQPISYYKGLIAADIFVHLLSVAMFYLLISKVNRGKGSRWNLVLSLLYFGGYPLYNLAGEGFLHWVDGMLMLMFMVYATLLLMREEVSAEKGIFYLLAGTFGLATFYPILMIMAGPMLLPEAILWCRKNLPKMPKKNIAVLSVLILCVAVGAVLIVGERIGHSWEGLFISLTNTEGPAPRQPYMDFLFFTPVFFLFLGLLHRYKEESRTVARMLFMLLAFTAAWLFCLSNGAIVGYYYYRVYYPLWLVVWLMTGQTIAMMIREKKQMELYAYTGFFCVVLFISSGKLDDWLWGVSEALYVDHGENVEYEKPESISFCPLYTSNIEMLWKERSELVSETEFGMYAYVNQNYQGKAVPMITSKYTAIHSEWYQAISGQRFHSQSYDVRYRPLYQVLKKLEDDGVEYATILKDEPLFINHYEEVFSYYEAVMENAGGALYIKPEEGWSFVIDSTEEITEEERAFFIEIMNREIRPTLVFDLANYKEAKYYAIYTAGEIDSWIHQTPADEFLFNTYQLNIGEVEYLAVLKDSEIYKVNREYFDAQQILYENEAGMLIAHIGSGWMPSEQD